MKWDARLFLGIDGPGGYEIGIYDNFTGGAEPVFPRGSFTKRAKIGGQGEVFRLPLDRYKDSFFRPGFGDSAMKLRLMNDLALRIYVGKPNKYWLCDDVGERNLYRIPTACVKQCWNRRGG